MRRRFLRQVAEIEPAVGRIAKPSHTKVTTMPIFTSEPATTVRRRSPWLFSKWAYGAIFLAVAMAAYGWKLASSRLLSADVPCQATAKLCIHHPNFAFQQAWQEILDQAKTEIRENLHVEAQRSGQETVVAISLSSLPAETVVPTVNVVASAYSQACRAQWKLRLEQAHSAAQEKVQQTERQRVAAQTRFELLRDRRLQALASVRPVGPPQPATIENPRWTELGRRLADLEERRKNLLLERTPLHPSVQEIETRIADARRADGLDSGQDHAGIACRISPKAPCRPTRRLPAEVQAAEQAAEQLKQDLQQAQSVERAALTACGEELQIDLLAAEPLPPPPAPHATRRDPRQGIGDRDDLNRRPGDDLLRGRAGTGLSSIAELQALLPVPIVGVIPATHPRPTPGRIGLAPASCPWGWMTAGLAVLLAVAWMLLHA